MRSVLLALFVAGAASAAAAQPLPTVTGPITPDLQNRLSAIEAQVDRAQRDAVIRDTQAAAVESQLRAQQGLADIRAQSATPRIPDPLPAAAPRAIDTGKIASMPDDVLAASDARVRAAAKNRR
jgi:hypothetical protein